MSNPKISKETDKEIEAYLRAGHSQNKTARKFGVSDGYVNKLSKRVNIHPIHSPPKKAISARESYTKERRRELLDKFLGKIDTILDSTELKPQQMQSLAIALGTAIDKCRIEEGTTGEGRAALLVLADKIKQNAEEAESAVRST